MKITDRTSVVVDEGSAGKAEAEAARAAGYTALAAGVLADAQQRLAEFFELHLGAFDVDPDAGPYRDGAIYYSTSLARVRRYDAAEALWVDWSPGAGPGPGPGPTPTPGETAGSVTQFGITVSFSEPVAVDQYADGSWWALGPVTITGFSLPSLQLAGSYSNGGSYALSWLDGMMIDPGNRRYAESFNANWSNGPQGLTQIPNAGDYPGMNYGHGLNGDPAIRGPATLSDGHTIVKARALHSPTRARRPGLLEYMMLTQVVSPPPPGALRPGVSGSDKTSYFTVEDFDLSVFPNLPRLSMSPTEAQLEEIVARAPVAFTADPINTENIHAARHQETYGREQMRLNVFKVCSALVMDYPAALKRRMLVWCAGIAFDAISRFREGAFMYAGGGGGHWRKCPAVMVLASLRDAEAQEALTELKRWVDYEQFGGWQEDNQVFRVSGKHVRTRLTTDANRPTLPYYWYMTGSPDWASSSFIAQPASTSLGAVWGSNWDNLQYRTIVATSIIGGVVAVALTEGGPALWNNPAALQYFMDITWGLERGRAGGGTNWIGADIAQFVEAYRPTRAAPVPVEAGIYGDAFWVRTSEALDERTDPSGSRPIPGTNGVSDRPANHTGANVPRPAIADFTVRVNGSVRAIEAVDGVFGTNVGGRLATPVGGGDDVVTISYTPGAVPVRNVDGVNMAAFSNLVATNHTEKVGGPNAAYPVSLWRRSQGIRYRSTIFANMGPASATGSLWLPWLLFTTNPVSNFVFMGHTGGPNIRLELEFHTDRHIRLILRNSSTQRLSQMRSAAIPAGAGRGVLFRWDFSQATHEAGYDVSFYDWGSATWTSAKQNPVGVAPSWWLTGSVDWTQNLNHRLGGTLGSNAEGRYGTPAGAHFDGEFGGLILDTQHRWTDAQRATLVRIENGNLAIGTRGENITGSIPRHVMLGNAQQWNDEFAPFERGSTTWRLYQERGELVDAPGRPNNEWR